MSRTTEALTIALVRCAARTAPSSLSARLEEEWLADMHERGSGLSRLRFAVGCYWACIAIGLQHRPIRVPAASSAHGAGSIVLEPPRFFSARAATFGLVLSLHAVVLCGLMMAGSKLFRPAEPPALEPRVIDRPAPPIKPPPAEFKHFVIDQPTPPPVLPLVEPPVDDKVPSILAEPNPVPLPPPVSPVSPRQVVRVQGGTGPTFPNPDAYYPDASRRLEEQGATLLEVCVDAAGRLTRDPENSETSGSARLDAAALRLAKAGSGHYRPTTEDGHPVGSCYPIKIRFQLRN
jgi:Gram-negative bacterial TonB protein C-terminal